MTEAARGCGHRDSEASFARHTRASMDLILDLAGDVVLDKAWGLSTLSPQTTLHAPFCATFVSRSPQCWLCECILQGGFTNGAK